jgi:hypothetical protein
LKFKEVFKDRGLIDFIEIFTHPREMFLRHHNAPTKLLTYFI